MAILIVASPYHFDNALSVEQSVVWAENPVAPVASPQTPEIDLEAVITGGDVSTTTLALFIKEEAIRGGVDPALALAIAKAESGLVWNAKNKNSSASGVYQWINGSWNSICRPLGFQDVFNPIENINCAIITLKEPQGEKHWEASRQTWSRQT